MSRVVAPLFLAAALAGPPALAQGLQGIIAPGAQPDAVQSGFQFTEGPVWSPDGSLYFSDVRANRIYRLGADGKATVYAENTEGANGLAFDRRGHMLAVQGGGACVSRVQDGRFTPLAQKVGDRPLVRPNDLIPDARGGVYFTDPGARPMPGETPDRKPSVYYMRPDGTVVLVDDTVARPNGISLSLDGKTLLVADSMGEWVIGYDVQPDGTVRNRRQFARLRDVEAARSGADGMAVDSRGRLYVTSTTGIQVFDPRGEHLGTITVPKKPSNLAFGGPDRKTLYITAGDTLYRLRMAAEGPRDRAK